MNFQRECSDVKMTDPASWSAYMRSVIRTAGFRDMRPRVRQVLLGDNEEVTEEHRHLNHHEGDSGSEGEEEAFGAANVERHHDVGTDNASANEQTPLLNNGKSNRTNEAVSSGRDPLQERLASTAKSRVEQLAQQRDEARAQMKDDEREPLLVAKVHRDDGTEAEVIVGQSTLPQTIFNSSNTLIGVGLLSLPLGIRYAGWVIGLVGLIASALMSKYTAGLLAKCIDCDSSLANFAGTL